MGIDIVIKQHFEVGFLHNYWNVSSARTDFPCVKRDWGFPTFWNVSLFTKFHTQGPTSVAVKSIYRGRFVTAHSHRNFIRPVTDTEGPHFTMQLST